MQLVIESKLFVDLTDNILNVANHPVEQNSGIFVTVDFKNDAVFLGLECVITQHFFARVSLPPRPKGRV